MKTAPMQRAGSSWRDDARLPVLGALCLVLAGLEYLIPKPLPFLRLGLANLPLILAVDLLPPGPWFMLVAIKVLSQALVGGSLVSWVFLFSLAGSLSSALVMYGLRRLIPARWLSLLGVSLAGAMTSNLAQLALSRVIVFGESARFMAPALLGTGLITGTLLGLFARHFAAHSVWYRAVKGGAALEEGPSIPVPDALPAEPLGSTGPHAIPNARPLASLPDRPPQERLRIRAFLVLLLTLASALLFIGQGTLPQRILLSLVFWALGALKGRRMSLLRMLISTTGIVFFSLLVPTGEVLARLGPFPITRGALEAGLNRALAIEGLLLLSRALITAELARSLGQRDGLLGQTLNAFTRLVARHHREGGPRGPKTRTRLVGYIDGLLIAALDEEYRPERRDTHKGPSILPSALILAISMLVFF